MSTLIKETDDELFLYEYLHHDPDGYPEWLCDKDGNCPSDKYSNQIVEAELHALYEVRIDYKIDKKTSKVILLNVRI